MENKLFILVDKNNIIRCVASSQKLLHQDKIDAGMKMYELTEEKYGDSLSNIFPGDEYDEATGQIINRPENYPPLPEELLNKTKIQRELELMAVERLIQKKELPDDYIAKNLSK